MRELTIGKNDAGQRLDRFVSKSLPLLPPALLQKYIRIKRIKVNGARAPVSYTHLFDLAAIVGTALRAHSVRQMQRATLGASHETGSRQLPHGAASLIALSLIHI